MAAPFSLCKGNKFLLCVNVIQNNLAFISTSTFVKSPETRNSNRNRRQRPDAAGKTPSDKKEFRKLLLVKKDARRFDGSREKPKDMYNPPRSKKMSVDVDWPSVWPVAQTYKQSVVPLPLRQGAVQGQEGTMGEHGLPPQGYANTELVKIPNFLHLTPRHIKQQCAAIKKFCTRWPEGLETPQQMKEHFPLEVTTSDYCFSSNSVRDSRARVVTFKFNMKDLQLDPHSQDKMKRLLGNRYDPQTGDITLVADRCPLKQQNYDYLRYVMTVLYFESWKTEPWEAEKTESDMEFYSWDRSLNKEGLVKTLRAYKDRAKELTEAEGRQLSHLPKEITVDSVTSLEEVKAYRSAVEELYNTGENIETLNNYKKSVMNLLKVQQPRAM